jgi:hypothetical protein
MGLECGRCFVWSFLDRGFRGDLESAAFRNFGAEVMSTNILLVCLICEVAVLIGMLGLQLESIKDQILTAIKDKALKAEVYGKFTQTLAQGRVPDLDVMAAAKLKADATKALDPEQR